MICPKRVSSNQPKKIPAAEAHGASEIYRASPLRGGAAAHEGQDWKRGDWEKIGSKKAGWLAGFICGHEHVACPHSSSQTSASSDWRPLQKQNQPISTPPIISAYTDSKLSSRNVVNFPKSPSISPPCLLSPSSPHCPPSLLIHLGQTHNPPTA